MINNIRHLRFVVAVARAKSLQEASRDLLISESALSTAVKSVEGEVGYSLFVRRPARALSLTEAGREFVAEAVAFLDVVDNFNNRVVGLGTEMAGTVRLASVSSFSAVLLPTILKRLREAHPRIAVEITEYELPELLTRLRDGDVDLALTYDMVYEADVEMRRLFRVRPYVVASYRTGHRTGDTVSLHDFVGRPLLLSDQAQTTQHILQMFTRLGLEPKIGMYPKSVRLLSALVAEDFGYAIYFMRSYTDMYGESPLMRLHIAEDVPSHHLALALPRRRMITARAKAVAEICEETMRAMGPSVVFRR